jgi:hypothetical protein
MFLSVSKYLPLPVSRNRPKSKKKSDFKDVVIDDESVLLSTGTAGIRPGNNTTITVLLQFLLLTLTLSIVCCTMTKAFNDSGWSDTMSSKLISTKMETAMSHGDVRQILN